MKMMMISSANWTMEPVYYKDGKLSICSNSQVHRVSIEEGEFKHLQSERAKGKHVRCITCDHTTIITDNTTIAQGEKQQVVSIYNTQWVGENGATDTIQGRNGLKASAVLHLDDKSVIVGFEDGQIFQDGIFVGKCQAKVTGLCMTADRSVLVADMTGSVSKIGISLEKVLQIPVDERENQNLRAYRLTSIKSPDNIQIMIASGDNGILYVINSQNEMIKVGDNPHNMPIIQILVDPGNPYQFITVGYDRVIAHWEVLPGGNYLEMLGCLHTLGSTVSHLPVSESQTLYVPQPHKLLVMNLTNQVAFDCQLPQSQLLELKVGPIDGLLLLRYQTRIVLFMTHTRETVLSFKVQSVVDAIFSTTGAIESQQYKYQGVSKESYSLLQAANFTVLALQDNQNTGFNILQLCQNNKHKIIKSGQEQMKRLLSQTVQYCDKTVLVDKTEIKGQFLAITQEVVLVATKSTLQLYCLLKHVLIAQYKLSFSIVQSCLIPNKSICALVTEDGHLRLFDLLKVCSQQLQCLCNTKLNFGFKQRVIAMTATSSSIIFATDDKCILTNTIAQLIQSSIQQQQSIKSNNKEPQTLYKNNKRLNQTSQETEHPLFGIVRSRVFFQQKLSDTQRVTAMLQSGEITQKIDLKLLRWRDTDVENIADAIVVIQMELDSCTRVERFEFYQKMVVLEYWLSLIESRPYNREVFDLHKDRFATETFITKFSDLLDGEIESGLLHLQVIQMLVQKKVREAIMIYSDQNYLTEAICLTKAFGDRETFKQVLTIGESRFSEAKDRQAQALKLGAALKQL